MKVFPDRDFLLQSETARWLYHEVAAGLPIIDYHCHLPPQDVAGNRSFANLFEIWLEGDHYKWRAMRSNGVDEQFCTGDADPYDKYLAWVRTVPHTLRNPLYHWSHLELQRYFDIDLPINETNARRIWERANERLQDLRARDILKKFKVEVVCTTDDPTDTLEHHIEASKQQGTRMYPTFRPDKALLVDDPALFVPWCEKLAQVSSIATDSFDGFLSALRQRHDFFHAQGGRLSDHGLETCYADFVDRDTAAAIFDRSRRGEPISKEEQRRFASWMMEFFGHLDAEKGWVKQLHLGAMRNNNSRLFSRLGPDTGFDSIGDFPQGRSVAAYLDRLDSVGKLPKTILYNLNPADNYVFATMLGNFQDGSIAGKIQLGSGWWFNDQKEGMIAQINALSNLGLLSRFVGMLTDSRSLLSYPRHEYFRRILCDVLGGDVENGELPDDRDLLAATVRNICYGNAAEYFGFSLPQI